MFEITTLTDDKTVRLPPDIAERFSPADRFIVWVEGDTVHLKRLATSPLKAVEEAPVGEPMSLDEINDVVHQVRRQRRKG